MLFQDNGPRSSKKVKADLALGRLEGFALTSRDRRRKISHDPQNTNWARNDTSFGHRQLVSQGWKPGQTLGAVGTPQAQFFTKASASHVRLALRDDNLGLGAKTGGGTEHGECIGLGGLQDLLGRLNGKSNQAIEKERQSRDEMKRRLWADRRYGSMGFVSGGLLLGGDIVEKPEPDTAEIGLICSVDSSKPGRAPVSAAEEIEDVHEATGLAAQRSKPRQISDLAAAGKLQKKTKRKRRRDLAKEEVETCVPETKGGEEGEDLLDETVDIVIPEDEAEMVERRLRKESKARKKAEKAQRKLDRHRITQGGPDKETTARKLSASFDTGIVEAPTLESTALSPRENPKSAPSTHFPGDRHAIRQRFILQKKKAMLDPKALNEVVRIRLLLGLC